VIRSRSGSSARLDIAVLERSTQPKSSADSARPKPFRHDGRAWDSDGRGIGFNGVCPREPSSSRDCWQASSSLVASAAVSPRATPQPKRARCNQPGQRGGSGVRRSGPSLWSLCRLLGAFSPANLQSIALTKPGEVIRDYALDQSQTVRVGGVDADDQNAGSGGEGASAGRREDDDATGIGPFGLRAENGGFWRMRQVAVRQAGTVAHGRCVSAELL
jgi:hypothetical protein